MRHKGQTIRAILGLLVATTVLAAGLGMGESIAVSLEEAALARFGPIDVSLANFQTFDADLVERLAQDARVRGEGVTGAATLAVTGATVNPQRGLAEAFTTIRGVGPREADVLGPLRALDGRALAEPMSGQVVLSEGLAASLEARVGDTIRLRAPPPGLGEDVDVAPVALLGAALPAAANQGHAVNVREGALGLGAQVTWTGDAGGPVRIEATAPSGLAFANESATSPVTLLVPPPLEEGDWTVRVLAPRPVVYQGGAAVAYLPADLAGGVATLELRVSGIAREEGRAAFTGRPTALLPLADLQRALDADGNVTHAYFHVAGDPHRAVDAIETVLGDDAERYQVRADKAEAIEDAKEAGGEITGFLLVMGGFTLLASILLAFTLFSALVEERRAELGIARALGLTRGEVAFSMTIEGALYAAAAAFVGLLLGIAILWALLAGITSFAQAEGGPSFALHMRPRTVALAFGIGTLLPLATIAIGALRFARLDPARAIRGIPDDPKTKRRTGYVVAAALVLLGALLSIGAIARLVGLPIALAGAGVAAWSAGRPRVALALGVAGVALIGYTLYSFTAWPQDAGELDPILTLGRGAVLALGLCALAVASAAPYERIARALRGERAKRSLFLALKYVVARRRPAGLTMAMIAIVVVVVTVMGTLFSVFSQTIPETEAGYSILGDSPLQLDGFPRPLDADLREAIAFAEFLPRHIELQQAEVTRNGEPFEFEAGMRQFLGVTDEFASRNEYEIDPLAPQYGTARDAWLAVARGEAVLLPSWALERNALEPGDRLTILTAAASEPVDVVIAGGVESDFVFQTFLDDATVRAFGFPLATQILVRVADDADANLVARRLTAEYAEDGVTFTSIPEEIARASQAIQALILVFESFLALGLFVGLAATGFLAARAVHERMRDIGTLRALGYEERDVRLAFMLESTMTAGVGLLVGTASGLLVAHSVWWREIRGEDVPFRPPWVLLAVFAVLVLSLAAYASNGPAKRASRLAPAIAVRHVE